MLSMELDLNQIKNNISDLISKLNLYPELFIICIDPLPKSQADLLDKFNIYANDIKRIIDRNQIFELASPPSFLPNHSHIPYQKSGPPKFDDELLKLTPFLFKDKKLHFYDEIAFLLQQYGILNIADSRNEVISQNNFAIIRSTELEREFLAVENEIKQRIGSSSWKIRVCIKKSLALCPPNPKSSLSGRHWEFKGGCQLPHDRFWADSFKRIFITTSVGLEFQDKHVPAIYRLSQSIRMQRSRFISY